MPGRQKFLFAPSLETCRWASTADDTLTDMIQERMPEEDDETVDYNEPCLTGGGEDVGRTRSNHTEVNAEHFEPSLMPRIRAHFAGRRN